MIVCTAHAIAFFASLYITMDRVRAILHEFMLMYQALGDPRSHAYGKALESLSGFDKMPHEVPNIGPSIRKKIDAVLLGKPIPKLAALRRKVALLMELQTVLGVGVETSLEWIAAGVESVAQAAALAREDKLHVTEMQRVGLMYYDDLHTRIPRDEVSAIARAVCAGAVAYEIVGSYRRGAATSGDVDVLVRTMPKPPNGAIMLTNGPDRMSFIFRIFARWRQVDILCAGEEEYPFALLYFTGSYEFNIAMRKRALALGWTLNQRGLVGCPAIIQT